MIAPLMACLFIEILVHVLNCISKSAHENCGHLKQRCLLEIKSLYVPGNVTKDLLKGDLRILKDLS